MQYPKVWEVNCRSRVSNAGFNVQELQKSGSSIAGSESPGILVQIPKVQEVLVEQSCSSIAESKSPGILVQIPKVQTF